MKTGRKKEWFDDDAFWREFYPFIAGRFDQAIAETAKILDLTKPKGQSVLDLGCGPGRFSLPLAQRGLSVTGVDRTKFYLDKARSRARAAGVKIEWVRQDMRDFVRPGTYDLALSMLTSFGYFENSGEDLHVLRNIFTSLRPGGSFLLDLMGKEVLARNAQPTTTELLGEHTRLVTHYEICDDWTRIRNEWLFICDGRVRSYRFHHTIYSGRELRDRLEQVGFTDVRLYGSLDGAPYGLNAQRLIVVGHKPLSCQTR